MSTASWKGRDISTASWKGRDISTASRKHFISRDETDRAVSDRAGTRSGGRGEREGATAEPTGGRRCADVADAGEGGEGARGHGLM